MSRLRMTSAEVEELLTEAPRAHVGTLNRDGTIHIVPLSFFLEEGRVGVWTSRSSQKVANLRRDPTVTCLVEVGAQYAEFRAVQIYGKAEIVETPDASRRAGEALFYKYGEGPMTDLMSDHIGEMAIERVVVTIVPERLVTWDHRKLAGVRADAG